MPRPCFVTRRPVWPPPACSRHRADGWGNVFFPQHSHTEEIARDGGFEVIGHEPHPAVPVAIRRRRDPHGPGRPRLDETRAHSADPPARLELLRLGEHALLVQRRPRGQLRRERQHRPEDVHRRGRLQQHRLRRPAQWQPGSGAKPERSRLQRQAARNQRRLQRQATRNRRPSAGRPDSVRG
jgi:hypothetical protein